MGQPGFISFDQKELLEKLLQSHQFTMEERESLLGSIEHLPKEEASAHINWALEQLPLRKEAERKEAAAELYQVVTQNFSLLGTGKARELYALCNDGKATTARYRQLKEEILEQLVES